ncbi:MAG: S9 family peptidase [Chloroflexota bacterium]
MASHRGLSPTDLMRFAWLQEIAITAGGDKIAYTVRRPRQNGYFVACSIYDRKTGMTVASGNQNGRVSSLTWSRDGGKLATVWQDKGVTEIQILSPDGVISQRHTLAADAHPTDLDWSPDGRRLAYSIWTRSASEPERKAGETHLPSPSVKVIRRLRYKQNGVGWVHDRFRQIWLLDLETGTHQQLSTREVDHTRPRWSWRGDRIACVGTAREQNTPLGYGQIIICDVRTGEWSRPLPDWEGAALSPQWKADDSGLVFAGHQYPPPIHRRIFHHVWYCDLQHNTVTELSESLDQTVGNYAVSDQRVGLSNVTVQWPAGTGPIYFLLTDQGATHLYRVGQSSPPEPVVGGDGVVFSFAAAQTEHIAYGQASPRSIGELYLRHPDGEAARSPITALNPWLETRTLSRPTAYWYAGLDETPVHAWEYKPVDFDPSHSYPVIVYVHCSMFSWDFSHEFQCLANAGYLVYLFNQRGTTAGYGQAHALGNYYGNQAEEFAEIMLGVDALSRRPYVDSDRLGVTGGSCGGFLTNWIVGHTDRFSAAVTQRSVTELVSKFGTSDNGPEQATSEGGGTPWTNVTHLWESSPIAYAPQINTPLLIIHSEEDHRCAVSQAEALFAALRWHGKEVELILFEGESHGLSNGGRPGNRIERLRRILAWFNTYLENHEHKNNC